MSTPSLAVVTPGLARKCSTIPAGVEPPSLVGLGGAGANRRDDAQVRPGRLGSSKPVCSSVLSALTTAVMCGWARRVPAQDVRP